MGYLRHECIVVNGDMSADVLKAHECASAIFNRHGIGGLVGGLTHHAINGGAAFLIAPDGSKEGWTESENGQKARDRFMEFLRSDHVCVNWALILIGGDDGEYSILQSPMPEPA